MRRNLIDTPRCGRRVDWRDGRPLGQRRACCRSRPLANAAAALLLARLPTRRNPSLQTK
jgi:hypothetical protein